MVLSSLTESPDGDRIDKLTLFSSLESIFSGLDFNPTGEFVATMCEDSICLISEVNTGDYRFHQKLVNKLKR